MKPLIFGTLILLGVVATVASAEVIFGTPSSVIPSSEAAQSDNFNDKTRTLSVRGTSTASVSPDRISISFAVESQEKTAQLVTAANAEITSLVIESLKAAGVTESELSTSFFNVYPVYEYAEIPVDCIQYGEGGQVREYCPPPMPKQVLIGYKAINSVQVDSSNLDSAGKWIDAAVQAGANRVDYVYFTVSAEKREETSNNLIADAVRDAQHKAEVALDPLGMEIVGVLNINLESYPVIYPKRGYEYASGAPSPTPIIPSTQEVSTSVHATFEIAGFEQVPANRTVLVSAEEEFQVTLDSNPSTGHEWQITHVDQALVRVANEEYRPPESGLVGAPGTQVFTFQALKEGKTTIELEYVRPWDPDNPAGVYSIKVSVLARS
jgi:hypothetical protein